MKLDTWLILAMTVFCAGLMIAAPPNYHGRIDTVSAGPWVVERLYATDHKFEFLMMDPQTGPDWTGMVTYAWRFDDHATARQAAVKLGGIVRPLRAVIGGQP